jgi:malate dehydrogenase (oxaloacetate-decarboxylating)
MSAIGVTKSTLSSQRIVIFGAGSAGLGVARQVRDAMVNTDGVSEEEANGRFWLVDRHGLVKRSLGEGKIREGTEAFVRGDNDWVSGGDGVSVSVKDIKMNEFGSVGLLEVVKAVKPTVLIGTSTVAGRLRRKL